MPTAADIAAGIEFNASDMAALWTEFDRRIGLMLDGKSPWILDGSYPGGYTLFGKPFFFVGAAPHYIAVGTPAYDHTPFTDAAAAVTETSRDATLGIMRVTRPDAAYFTAANLNATEPNVFFAHSLEAHKRDGLYLWEPVTTVPEKQYDLAVAELIFDDYGTTFEVPLICDKYKFFRIHNLQAAALTVTFEGTAVSIEIPRWGCVAVRRDSTTEGYDYSLQYFWIHQPDDGRFLQMLDPITGNGKEVYATMPANNVANPSVLFKWIAAFTADGGVNGVQLYRDPHELYDIYPLYSDLFADPADGGALIGDVVHHKGGFRLYRSDFPEGFREVRFDGYASFADALAAVGLTLTDTGPNLTISAPSGSFYNELLAHGTNLFGVDDGSGGFRPVTSRDCTAPIALDTRSPSHELQRFVVVDADQDATYLDAASSPVTVTRTIYGFQQDLGTSQAIQIYDYTVGDVMTLNAWGNPADDGTFQDIANCTFENRRVVLTLFGPKILFERKLLLTVRSENLFSQLDAPLANPLTEIVDDAGDIYAVSKHVIDWPACGWGTESNIGCYIPRARRKYSVTPAVDAATKRHPDVNDAVRAGGKDFALESIGESYLDTFVTALCPAGASVEGSTDGVTRVNNLGRWDNPDYLYEATSSFTPGVYTTLALGSSVKMPRVYMAIEFYNTMAAAVNSLKKAAPLNWAHAHNYVAPNNTPIEGTDILPIDQYATAVYNPYSIATTDAELPAIPEETSRSWRAVFTDGSAIGTVSEPDLGTAAYPASWVLGASVPIFEGYDPETVHTYITIAAAKAFAEDSGFLFIYQNTARELGLTLVETSPTAAERSYTTGAETFEGGSPTYSVFSDDAAEIKWRTHTFVDPGSLDAPAFGFFKNDADPGDLIYLGSSDGTDGVRISFSDTELPARYALNPATGEGNTIANYVWAPRTGLVIRACSAGVESGSKVVMIPEQAWIHTTTDYSGDSMANFIRKFVGTPPASYLPMDVDDDVFPSTVTAVIEGNNTVEAPDPQDQMIVFADNTVDLT